MKILLWVVVAFVIAVLIPIVIALVNLMFINRITEFKLQRGADFKVLDELIEVIELENNEGKIIDAEGVLDPKILLSGLPVGVEVVLNQEGVINNQKALFADEIEKPALQLNMKNSKRELIFIENKVHLKSGNKLGELVWHFKEFHRFQFVNYIDENTIILAASSAASQYAEIQLWQVNLDDFSKTIISTEPYYPSTRPPKVFVADNNVIAVYYEGTYSFAHGGPSSRPKKSIVRMYSKQSPKGKNLVSIYYKGGTVIDAQIENNTLLLTADPSRPYMVDDRERPARFWEVTGF